jgi:aryl-alcohol dehydrogenase-like predicted oxidoreductase
MKLCLGTAQIGMPYGINNDSEYSLRNAKELIRVALDNGIYFFDTAQAYGQAESILGELIAEHEEYRKCIEIVTKLGIDEGNLRFQVEETLKKFNTKSIDGCLLHDSEMMYDASIISDIIAIKKEGVVGNIGVSLYKAEDALFAANQEWVDYIQIPYNVFDQRLDRNNFFQVAKENGKTVFARSVLLQGLLGMEPLKVSIKLPMAHEEIIRFNKIVGKYCITPIEAAVQFVKAKSEIDFLVFGVDNKEQLCSFLRIFNREEQQLEMIEELKVAFRNVDERIIMPPLWAKGKS